MSIEFREMTAAEWPDGLALWEQVFKVGPWLFHSLHKAHADRRFSDCSCAWDGDDLVSAVDVFMRPCLDASGQPRRQGGIGSVATLEQYRGMGLSSRLLTRAISVMEEQGCQWSMLFTGVNAHYAKQGWRDVQTFQRKVALADREPQPPSGFTLEWKSYWKCGEEEALAPLHASFNAGRPLTLARDAQMWRLAARPRLNRPDRSTLLAVRDGLEGYLVVEFAEGWFEILEAAGSPEALEALAEGMLAEGRSRSTLSGALLIPRSQELDPFVDRLCSTLELEALSYTMAMPVAGRMSWDEIEAVFADPRAQHYRLDDF